jgi:hypothetical protein
VWIAGPPPSVPIGAQSGIFTADLAEKALEQANGLGTSPPVTPRSRYGRIRRWLAIEAGLPLDWRNR